MTMHNFTCQYRFIDLRSIALMEFPDAKKEVEGKAAKGSVSFPFVEGSLAPVPSSDERVAVQIRILKDNLKQFINLSFQCLLIGRSQLATSDSPANNR